MKKTAEKATSKNKKQTLEVTNSLTYQQLVGRYLRECKLRNLAPVTIKGYETASNNFLKFTGEDLLCTDVTQDLIDSYKISLIEKHKPETVNSYMFKISPVVKFGIKLGYIEEDILFNHMKEQERTKDIYTEEELKRLLVKPKGNSFSVYRNWVIINFLIGTGVRAKELRELRVKDIDIDLSVIDLSHTKNRKVRKVPMSTSLKNTLEEYLTIRDGEGEDYLFCTQYGEELTRTALQSAITKYCYSRVAVYD